MDDRIGHLRFLYWMLVRRLFYPRARLYVKGKDGLWHDANTWEARQS